MASRERGRPAAVGLFVLLVVFCAGCAGPRGVRREMVVTAYSGDRYSCEWERGSWKYLKLDVWNRYVSRGSREGERYDGRTASGTKPVETGRRFFVLPRKGTIAADTNHYPFGTRMYVPGYGWGVVEDRGGAIKGPERIDVFMKRRKDALEWGRKRLVVKVVPPD